MRALIGYVRSGDPDLTNRQMALLMLVYLTPGPHTVRGLARILGVSKPVVTRALNTLGTLGYLRRDTGTAFVVVMGTDRTRYSHPTPSLIGKKFIGHIA
ncbi:MAG: MarR family transcriptional regulator, partial [Sphingomicrobium sp.]